MSLAEIEAELAKLSLEELRRLALKSWSAFVQQEGSSFSHECDEDDQRLLTALDHAVAAADSGSSPDHPADDVRARLREWISK